LRIGFRPKGNNMTKDTQYFSDGAAYELFMGRWSRAVGDVFLNWVAPPKSARWIDIGCGTGVFTELILDTCAPASVVAVDPSAAQVDIALSKPIAQRADFRVADAQSLPFPDGAFDVVASSLVINFIPDRPKALAEMRRVCRPGGLVAGYVWDFAGERGASSPIRIGLRQIGAKLPTTPGSEDTRLDALMSLFKGAGLKDIVTRTIEVTTSFPDFDDFWRSQTPGYSPIGKAIASLTESERVKLIGSVRTILKPSPDGKISYSAYAHAIKAQV
jgi:SAM-dependent methyltransferase